MKIVRYVISDCFHFAYLLNNIFLFLSYIPSFCFQGWIEPLLDPIARNPKAAVVPLIEIIDDSTFQMIGTSIQNIQVGGFDWNLIFNWHVTPEREMKRRTKKTDPIRYEFYHKDFRYSFSLIGVQQWLVVYLLLIVNGLVNLVCMIQVWKYGVVKISNYLSR